MSKRVLCVCAVFLAVNWSVFADMREDSKGFKISGGENHTLVLTKDNKLWGCGNNNYYQLGIGDTRDAQNLLVQVHGPNNIGYLTDINDMDAGFVHSIALDNDGFAWTWGNNYYGQLGNGENGNNPKQIPVCVHSGAQNSGDYLVDIEAVAAGRSGSHSLAVDCNEQVLAWGANYSGQLGIGSYDNALEPNYVVDVNEAGRLNDIIAVSAGKDSSIALGKIDTCDSNCCGYVYTWGNNGNGQLGNDSNVVDSNTPVRVVSGEQDPCDADSLLCRIVAIDSGWDHLIALEEYDPCVLTVMDGDPNYGLGYVYTWGRNKKNTGYSSNGGQLGIGYDGGFSKVPVQVLTGEQQSSSGYLQNIVAVSAGDSHSMALDFYGNVWCWGDNGYGQLGNGRNDPCSTPVKVVGKGGVGYLERIVAISAGYWHNIAIDEDGVIWVWGEGGDGRLGKGHHTDGFNTPQKIGVVYNLTQEEYYFGIQPAIDDANSSGDRLEASDATYYEDVDFLTKTIALQSIEPNNWDIIEDTIIYGSGSETIPAVAFNNNPNSILTGFTILNDEEYGIKSNSSSPSIINNVIENCGGHGLYCLNDSMVEIVNCKISGNGFVEDEDGVNCDDSKIVLSNCLIENSGIYGVYCDDSDLNVTNSVIKNNTEDGVRNLSSSGCSIMNNEISGNGGSGVYSDCDSEIKNNWIFDNGADNGGDGIYIDNDPETTISVDIRNNTIVDNGRYGIRLGDGSLETKNNIVWGNGTGQLNNCSASFSCIENGDVNNCNIVSDPCFVDAGNNDFHLRYESGCIDVGDSNGIDANEVDIDGESRILDSKTALRVDIGADEYYYSNADFNNDEVVNFIDYAMLVAVWDMNSNDVNDYDDVFDLYDDDVIDGYDLAMLADEWLWEPAWAGGYAAGAMMRTLAMDGGGGLELMSEAAADAKPSIFVDNDLVGKWLIDMWKTDKDFHNSITLDELNGIMEALE